MSHRRRAVLNEAVSWITAIGIVVVGVLFFHDMKDAIARNVGIERIAAAGPTGLGVQTDGNGGEAAGDNGSLLRVIIPARGDGHFYADAFINGHAAPVLIDTGASFVALPYETAADAGIRVRRDDFTASAKTANGIARIAPVVISELQIGSITLHRVQAAVAEPGAMHVTLLGMSFLRRLKRAELRGDRLILEQ